MNLPEADENRSAITILIVALLCVGLFARGFDSGLGQALSCLLSSIALMLCFLLKPSERFWQSVRYPLLLVVAALAWLVIVGSIRATGGVSFSDLPFAPDLFLAKFLSVVAGLWSLLIGAIIGVRPANCRLATNGILLFVTAFSFGSLCLLILPHDEVLWAWSAFEKGRLLGMAGNSNVTASICGAGAVLCFARAVTAWGWSGRHGNFWAGTMYLTMFLVNFVALILTASRFPALVTVLSLAILCLYEVYVSGWSFRRTMLPLGVACGIALLSLGLFSEALFHRAANIGPEAFVRWTFWAHFGQIATGAPWTGYGPGAFPQANVYFLQHSSAAVLQTWGVNSPHSILLQLWFVGGLPYLFLILAAAGLIGRDLVRRFSLRCGSLHIGLILASGVVMAVGAVDIALDMPASTNLALLLIGLAWTSRFNETGGSVGRAP